MSVDRNQLALRAEELLVAARSFGLNSIEAEVALLPDDDLMARIGYLASVLGIDLGLACDPEADIGLAVM